MRIGLKAARLDIDWILVLLSPPRIGDKRDAIALNSTGEKQDPRSPEIAAMPSRIECKKTKLFDNQQKLVRVAGASYLAMLVKRLIYTLFCDTLLIVDRTQWINLYERFE